MASTVEEQAKPDRRAVPDLALEWFDQGRAVAIATLVGVSGSAPIDPGASMIFDADKHVEGSVTGGCVEGALAGEAEAVLAGSEARLVDYGISDELAGTVGLMCGGEVEVLVRKLDEAGVAVLHHLRSAFSDEQAIALAILLNGPNRGATMAINDGAVTGGLGVGDRLDASVTSDAMGLLAQGQSLIRWYGGDGARTGDDLGVYIHAYGPSPRLIICGAVDFSIAVARQAREMGYRVTICDPRQSFVSSSRLQAAAEVVREWPDAYLSSQALTPRDAVLIFTHDSKFDEPASIAAVRSDVGYVGALGSRRTHADRIRRLREAGLSEEETSRIVCPAGLDIGSSTPAETAISILAEITAVKNGIAPDATVQVAKAKALIAPSGACPVATG
ncbi:MAG: XdhC family protein [bacterium]